MTDHETRIDKYLFHNTDEEWEVIWQLLADVDETRYQNKPFVLTVGNVGQMLLLIEFHPVNAVDQEGLLPTNA